KSWQPGSYEDVELMILQKHESTGGVVVLRKFKARHTILAHTAFTGVSPSASRSIPMICSSPNLLFLIVLLLFLRSRTLLLSRPLSGSQVKSGVIYTRGVPKGVRHGPHGSHQPDHFDGPLTVM